MSTTATGISGKVIIVTGSGSGFGRVTASKAAHSGARVVCTDINQGAVEGSARQILEDGGVALPIVADVTSIEDMRDVVMRAVEAFGRVDALVNNAGTMPLAYLADHAEALEAWNRCIDINFKGVLNGTVAVYDQMLRQEFGHIVNVSSIYANHPVAGAAVYGATKAAVSYFSEAVRQESRGKIKVSVVKPAGSTATALSQTVVNPKAAIGIVGQNAPEFLDFLQKQAAGSLPQDATDHNSIRYCALAPELIADAILHVLSQPMGVTLSDVTVRGANDPYIL